MNHTPTAIFDPPRQDTVVRSQVGAAIEVLGEARSRLGRLRLAVRQEITNMLASLAEAIRSMPQLSLIRPALIAMHNVTVSLGEQEQNAISLGEEVDQLVECLEELLRDRSFGVTERELTQRVNSALVRSGRQRMTCGHQRWELEFLSLSTRPFPCDPNRAYADRHVAMRTCAVCGAMTMHDLRVLGVIA